MKALSLQHLDQIAALLFGIAEGQRADRPVVLEQHAHGLQALVVLDLVKTLTDLAVGVLFAQLHFLWIALEAARQRGDRRRIGRRKQQRLALGRAVLGHVHDVVMETHVEHAISLIEHQRVEPIQIEAAALQVVHDPPRRANHDMRAMGQGVALWTHRRAAAQRQHLDVVFGAGQPADFLRHLVGQLAGRAQHHRLHRKPARVQLGQQRQRKGGGLAAAGFGLSNDVVPRQRHRQAGGLDRGHVEIAKLHQRGLHGGRQGQRGKRRRGRGGGLGCGLGGGIGVRNNFGHAELSRLVELTPQKSLSIDNTNPSSAPDLFAPRNSTRHILCKMSAR